MKPNFHLSILLALSAGVPLAHADTLAQAWRAQTMPSATSVAAGHAPIEQALSTIIPKPYRIALDQSIPASAMVVWPAGTDWMKVLRAAVAPLDLYVEPDWSSNIIRIVQVSHSVMPAQHLIASRPMRPASTTSASSDAEPAPQLAKAAGATIPWKTLPPGAFPVSDPLYPKGAGATSSAGTMTKGMAASRQRQSFAVVVKPKDASAVAKKPAPDAGYTIPAGTLLSTGLASFVKSFGWTLKWNVTSDYMLDEPLPIPAGSIIDGVNYVMRAYQSQGGLLGVRPVYAKPNKVVSVQPAEIEDN